MDIADLTTIEGPEQKDAWFGERDDRCVELESVRARAARTNDLIIELTPVERMWRRTPLVGVGEYRCGSDHPQFRGGGPETCPYIIFSRLTVSLEFSRGRPEVCSPVNVHLLDIGDSYARKPVSKDGIDCDWIAMSPSLLRDITAGVDEHVGHRSGSVFDRLVAPISARVFYAQRRLFESIRNESVISALEFEDIAIRLVDSVLRETIPWSSNTRDTVRGKRKNPSRVRDIVEATKQIVTNEYNSDLSIEALAARVYCSPAYLSRNFAKFAGCTLHNFQQQVRLRTSLQLLQDGSRNGTEIALHLGYANHSHFCHAFKQAFGVTPTRFVATISAKLLRDSYAMVNGSKTIKS